MTKQEVIDRVDELSNKLDDIEYELKQAKRLVEDLPGAVDDIEE